MIRKKNGFTLLEVIMAIAVSTVMLSGLMAIVHKAVSFRGTTNTITNVKKIKTAFENLYRDNVKYVEDTCYGWTGAGCTSLSILPVLDAGDATGATLFVDTYSAGVVKSFEEAGCTLTLTAEPRYQMTCTDGYGSKYLFTGVTNTHPVNALYLNGYNRTPYTITVTSGGNSQITDQWSSGYLDSEYMARSQEKVLTIARGMKTYHLSRTVFEAIKNPCTAGVGGLESSDDIIIPWIWQAVGTSPSVTCSGISAGSCGCTGFTAAIWQSNVAYNTINTVAMWTAFLNGIGLNASYRVDGFGNPITVGLLTQPNGTILASAPNTPAPTYTWVGASPPYGGHVGVRNGAAWVYSERVVYAQ